MALLALILVIEACAGFPSPILPFATGAGKPKGVLARCLPTSTEMCLVSFGVQEPDRMLVSLSVPAGSSEAFSLRVTYKDKSTVFPCVAASSFQSTVYCTGSQVPLGSTITIEALAAKGGGVLYAGDFVLNALALPTVALDSGTATTTPKGSPTPGLGYPNP
jgi:hypothetical protein